MKLYFALLSFILAAPALPFYIHDGRISNGTVAKPGDFPYVVFILENSTSESKLICSGLIYNPRYVITAASCLKGLGVANLEVVAGQQELEAENGQRRTIQRMIPHESYDETTGLNDLAVLETEVAFIYDGTSVNQVACGELDTTVPKATTMGWGEQSDGLGNSSSLASAVLTLPGNCSGYNGYYDQRYMICAGTEADVGGPCHKDEGVPLIQTRSGDGRKVAIGIASKNLICPVNGPTFPSIYTRLTAYYSWLLANAGVQ